MLHLSIEHAHKASKDAANGLVCALRTSGMSISCAANKRGAYPTLCSWEGAPHSWHLCWAANGSAHLTSAKHTHTSSASTHTHTRAHPAASRALFKAFRCALGPAHLRTGTHTQSGAAHRRQRLRRGPLRAECTAGPLFAQPYVGREVKHSARAREQSQQFQH